MEFQIAAVTDVGITKETNQDSLLVKTFDTHIGNVALVVLCDGMGGLEKGELASATAVKAFEQWSEKELPYLEDSEDYAAYLRWTWTSLIQELNSKIECYGKQMQIRMGTTIVAMLITQKYYYLLNIGDSRAYEIGDAYIGQLTEDQTLVAREVQLGTITLEQAEHDPRRNVLLQCVGASPKVYPDISYGKRKQNCVYLFCSDGFRHEVNNQEIHRMLQPSVLQNEQMMQINLKSLVDLNISRNETDNITAAVVKTV